VSDTDNLVVMLDAQDAYHQVADQETDIYWGPTWARRMKS
jgi:precorrin-6A synthase